MSESAVAALSARTLWLRARDIAASSGAILDWRSYDGEFATHIRHASVDVASVTTTSPPPLSSKSVHFSGSTTVPPFVIGRDQPHTGVVAVTASSSLTRTTPASLLNGESTTWWTSNTIPASVTIEYATGFIATQVYLQSLGGGSAGQSPKDWTFEGSNDGSSWTTLDTRTGENPASGTTYTFSNSTSYRFYKINVTAVQSASYINLTVMRVLPASGGPFRAVFNSTGAGEVWAVLKSGSTGKGGPFKLGASVETFPASHYPWTDGTVYNDFGSTTRRGIDPASTLTGWHILRMSMSSGGTLTVQIDGATRATHSGLTTGYQSALVIGGGDFSGTYGSDVYMAELITFNAALSGGDATTVFDYLTAQHFTAPSATTGVVAATLPSLTASVAATSTVTSVAAATLPALSASSAATSTVMGVAAATLPALSASVAVTADDTSAGTVTATLPALTSSAEAVVTHPAAIGATLPALTSALSVTVTNDDPAGSIGATLPALSAAVVVDSGTSLDPWTDGAHGEALLNLTCPPGVLEITYPVTEAPAHIVEVSLQRASHQMPALTGVRAMDYDIVTDVIGTPHVWVDGVDVTYFRDIPTKIAGWRQESPFTWTSTTLTFPQVFHYEERGTGDLSWMVADKAVEIALVTPLGERLHRFTGQLTSEDPGTGRGRTECVWGVEGLLWQADHAHHPVPARLDPTDVGTLVPDELNGTPARRWSPIARVTTGITSRKRGGHKQTRWGYSTDHLAVALDEDGNQWSLDATGPRSFAMVLKDATTVHWTITAGAPGVELDLSHDHHERIDAVYASGIGPDGYAWWNYFYPSLLPYDPPDYLYADAGDSVHLGDTDAGTLTGTGISDWQRRIRDLGYTTLAVDGVMGSADIAAVKWIQRKRGILVDGVMGPQTWAATWNIGAIGGDLSTLRLPMAVRSEVEPFLYGANGAVVSDNPDYDPSIIRHEIDVDLGAGVTKEQGREMAQRILERGMDPGIVGTLTLMTCPWEGSRWEMNAGENVLIKGFRGEDVLCRIVALDADPEALTVKITVDSEFRDAMTVVQVLERNRESKADPARRPGNPNKRSRLDQDMATPFEGESPAGRLPRLPLREGLWTVWPVPVSEVGIIAKLRMATTGPASRFAFAFFGKPVTANQVAAKVPDPLAVTNPWADAGDAWLESVGWIEGWGEQGAAAGYGLLGSEADGSDVTGTFYDDAGVPYVSQVSPWVWVALYSPESCFIEGRIYPDVTQ